jgi:hypothetical protein
MRNHNGFAIVACLMIMTILLMSGVFGVQKSSTELSIVRNEGQILLEFYDAEAGLVDALENYKTWMSEPFLLTGELAKKAYDSTFTDKGGTPVAAIQARCIENSGTPVFGTPKDDDPADDVPVLAHIAPPPAASGYSMLYFESRKYGVTATSTDGNTQLQVGVWKVFNKF